MPEETKNPPDEQQPQAEEAQAEDVQQAAEPAEAAEAAEAAEDSLPKNQVTVEDAGTLRKKVSIEVPRERIDAKFNEMFGELDRTAQVPGFRIGRAPRKLIEKRFGKDVADDVRNAMVGEATGTALEEADFKPIGEPHIKLDEIKLPDEGPMSFSLEVEVAPEFELPDYKGIEVRQPNVEITEQNVEGALTEIRQRHGTLRPVDDPAAEGDTLIADVSVTGEGLKEEAANQEVRVAPGAVAGIPLEDLGKALAGKKAGDECQLKTKVPSGHPNEAWRDKDVTIGFKVQEVKRLELPELDEAFAAQAGFASVEGMREGLRQSLERRVSHERTRLMRDQVRRFFLENTELTVPDELSERHAARLLQRLAVGLMMRGTPREQIERDLDKLKEEAAQRAAVELKLSFIMGRLVEAEEVEVTDGEVNAQIAAMARQNNRRPERLRQDMANDGTLDELLVAMREEKAVDKVLAEAKIVVVGDDQAAEAPQQPKNGADKKKHAQKPTKGKK